MIGLDTNVIVRALVGDDVEQSAAAQRLWRSLTPATPGFISLIALVETVWVLRQTYRYSRETVLEVVGKLLGAADLVIEQADLVRQAVAVAQELKRDLPDALIALGGRQAGCGETVTFDRRATDIPGMALLDV